MSFSELVQFTVNRGKNFNVMFIPDKQLLIFHADGQGRREGQGAGGKLPPGPQAARSLVTLNASRSGGLIK